MANEENVIDPEDTNEEKIVNQDSVSTVNPEDEFDIKPWLKPDTPPDLVNRVTRIQRISSYSGPLPPAYELDKYEQVLPGAADRIIALAENSLDFQREAFREKSGFVKRRLTASTIVSLGLIGASVTAIILDPAWLSIPLGIGGILTLIFRELLGKSSNSG